MKNCKICGTTRQEAYSRSANCKPCDRKAARDRGAKKEARRRRHLDRYKVSQGCINCGYNDHAVALDFHHRDPSTKRKGVSDMLTHKLEDLIKEVRKCDVLCSNCHRVEEHGECS